MVICLVVLVHLAAVLLFSRGFLLSRLALTDVAPPSASQQRPPPTHTRAVVLIIDALRFDFLSPDHDNPNPFHHHVLTLPAELTRAHPHHSFLFNAYADPPTTTLQRIKALTTGSLPTFVDMGSNFDGSAILEDSLINQLQRANKSMAFMGDDTWLSVFPSSFHPNLTFPYDSFNVEDLHTVDTGVLTHLFPLLLNQHPATTQQPDFLLGHFLGVDHVGHRVGPSHPSMHAKLKQMDNALRRVVDLLDDDTLLVVLGDHGMDRAGDHGGDGVLETSSALWIYSKGRALIQPTLGAIPSGLVKYKTFPGTSTPWRAVQQIDLVPTLSLLLGLPIPYNNLGSIIPELFWRKTGTVTELSRALELNSDQIHRYLSTYRSSPSGRELDSAWAGLENTWDAIDLIPQLNLEVEAQWVAWINYNRAALGACRAIWAQFNPVLMAAGLGVMVSAVLASGVVYLALSSSPPSSHGRRSLLEALVPAVWKVMLAGSLTTFAVYQALCMIFPGLAGLGVGVGGVELAIFVGVMLSCVACLVIALAHTDFKKTLGGAKSGLLGVLILVLHTASFFSNSFTFWEDRIVLWLCATSIVPILLCGIAAPGVRETKSSNRGQSLLGLRGRILGFGLLFLICVRLMSMVTVCREEQGAYCHVTFYATPSSASVAPPPLVAFEPGTTTSTTAPLLAAPPSTTTSTTPPTWSLLLSLPTALVLPYIVIRILRVTKSDKGIAPTMVWLVFAPALVGAWAFWTIEWIEAGGLISGPGSGLVVEMMQVIEKAVKLRVVRTWIGRCVAGWIGVGLVGWYWAIPLCLDIRVSSSTFNNGASDNKAGKQVVILGYANAFGVPFLLFYLLAFALVYLCTPLPGQVVLGTSLVALLSYLEAVDAVRDAEELEKVVRRSIAGGQSQQQLGQEEEPEMVTMMTMIPLILLAFITFYATGHQSTVSSIQWKTAFVVSEKVRYPWSVMSVVGNSLGSFGLLGIGVGGLVAGWKQAPSTKNATIGEEKESDIGTGVGVGTGIRSETLRATILVQFYFLVLLLGASMSAAVLRRHLMVWKVFAPRFMAGVVQLLMVDVGILGLCGVGGGVTGRVVERVEWVLARVGIGRVGPGKEE